MAAQQGQKHGDKDEKKSQYRNTPIISTLQRLRQEDYKFKTRLGYTGDLVPKEEEKEDKEEDEEDEEEASGNSKH